MVVVVVVVVVALSLLHWVVDCEETDDPKQTLKQQTKNSEKKRNYSRKGGTISRNNKKNGGAVGVGEEAHHGGLPKLAPSPGPKRIHAQRGPHRDGGGAGDFFRLSFLVPGPVLVQLGYLARAGGGNLQRPDQVAVPAPATWLGRREDRHPVRLPRVLLPVLSRDDHERAGGFLHARTTGMGVVAHRDLFFGLRFTGVRGGALSKRCRCGGDAGYCFGSNARTLLQINLGAARRAR
eukprot:INCI14361.2.p2 GENE.INCI14361.2~~INCI14361.2.p2  ORF type:complete len:236 (-),score=19.37 INCI14361.2:613-1320(-)